MLSRSTACCLATLTAFVAAALPASRAQDSAQAASQYLPQSAVLHARLESMRYVLNTLDYEGKENAVTGLNPDPDIVLRYHRSNGSLD